MPTRFDLVITADPEDHTAELLLLDGRGEELAAGQADFGALAASRRRALFDLREHLDRYVDRGQEANAVAELGVGIAEDVLGAEVFERLWASEAQRTVQIQLPGATEDGNPLAAALARVPWEMARPAIDKPTLAERNLVVRVVHDREAPATQPLDLEESEPLRVLFVFAESPGSRPLAARMERQQLRQLFEREVYPGRRVVADFLTHGVTRERLEAQIVGQGGYHVLHWSGHGHLNLLELARTGGGADFLTGDELLDLCGGYLPRLVFLSACHSGDILRVRDWQSFLAVARDRQRTTRAVDTADALHESKDIEVAEQPGFTGTAHALLQRGVPTVVAMRYAVGDDYARDLAIDFYRALLAHPKPKPAAAAITLARRALHDPKKHDTTRYHACDHATPVLYGAAQPGLALPPGRSPALDARSRRLHRIAELSAAGHAHFVGRSAPLAGLGARFIGAPGSDVDPVALITGLGGMGKTALAAEALSLWERQFDWLLLYQAKPSPLGFGATLRDIHLRLSEEQGRYHHHVQAHPADAIFRPAGEGFTGDGRLDRLARNLVRAMRDEAILLVLDNFETNLAPEAVPIENDTPRWACQDPAWDRCLTLLAHELGGTRSRTLITCRRPLAALDSSPHHHEQIGPLPPGEAALYVRTHPQLSRLAYSSDEGEAEIALRLLAASRFHPLLMDRLARLATGGPKLRPKLLQALDALESSHDFQQLPALFSEGTDAEEVAYLEDALATSLDQLIADASPDARRLLWTVAMANEPVTLRLLESVWSGESQELEQLRQLQAMLGQLDQLPLELREHLEAMPPEVREQVDALPARSMDRPDPAPLLRHLVAVGLMSEKRSKPDDRNPELSCHELVRERVRAWMADHAEDRGDLTENGIRLSYADRLIATYRALQHRNMTAALEAGSRALVYCAEAKAWERLGGFASQLVTSTADPRLLAALLPHLEAAADAAPEGQEHWSCLCTLADALRNAGRPEASLRAYRQAASEALAVAEADGLDHRQAWRDVAWISGNWAFALVATGDLDGARQRHIESAQAHQNTESPAIHVVGRELEALRIDIMKGKVREALPEVERRLRRVEGWWRQHRAGEPTPEAPNSEFLARALVTGLDIARQAHLAQRDFETALHRVDAVLALKRLLERPAEDIARDRMNRANLLGELPGRLSEAQAEMEACLEVFRDDPAAKATVLGSLAILFSRQGDFVQAITQGRRALAIREHLPNPSDRATSHHNLANYLEHAGSPPGRSESGLHQLAALGYRLVAGLGQHLQTSLLKYALDFRRAQSDNVELTLPTVAELLADPAFRPLAAWLEQRQVDADAVQAAVDQALEHARQMAAQQE